MLNHYWIIITVHKEQVRVKTKAGTAQVACMWTHCLNSVRPPILLPSWTASWARDPLYWTTLTLDSFAANWKEKHCIVTVCYVYKHVFSSVNISGSHPSWLIISKVEEESHWRDIKASSKTTHNIFHSHFLFWDLFLWQHFRTSLKTLLRNTFGIILNQQHNPQRSNVGYPTEAGQRWMNMNYSVVKFQNPR